MTRFLDPVLDGHEAYISILQVKAIMYFPESFVHLSFHMLSPMTFWCCLTAFLSLSLASSKNPKRGLGFTAMPDDIINANQSASVISWLYNWASIPPAYLATSNIKYIPMQWGSSGIQAFSGDVQVQEADTILVRQQFFSMLVVIYIFDCKIFRLSMNQIFRKSPI